MTKFYRPEQLPKASKRPAKPASNRESSQHAVDRAHHLAAARNRATAAKSGWSTR